jgi:hypothetical protein
MLSRFQLAGAWRSRAPLPGAGVLTVFMQRLRGRSPWRDLLWTAVLVMCQQALALALESRVTPVREYLDSPRFLLRWLSMEGLAAPLLYLPLAAALGAFAAPPAARFEETQSMLLTRLSSFDICAGRLMASLWPVISALLASCALTLSAQLVWRVLLPGTTAGYVAIFAMHAVLLASVLAIGAVAMLCALRRRPGRVWARGAGIALAAAGLAICGIFLCNSVILRMDNPTGLIYGLLLVNPATAATSSVGVDVLRQSWLYDRTNAHDFLFVYPPAAATAALFAGGALAALAVASVRLRRAYR